MSMIRKTPAPHLCGVGTGFSKIMLHNSESLRDGMRDG
jgi:hypothetical protein